MVRIDKEAWRVPAILFCHIERMRRPVNSEIDGGKGPLGGEEGGEWSGVSLSDHRNFIDLH